LFVVILNGRDDKSTDSAASSSNVAAKRIAWQRERGKQRHSDALSTQRHSEARRGTQRHSEARRGTQRHSEALRGTQRHSEALRGTQRHAEALRGTQVHSEAIRGT
jgi:hypothetical protein